MEQKRKVVFYKYEKVKGQAHFDKVLDGTGIFHEFGVDYEELETGPGSYSTAIIETPDGSIRNVPVEMVVFNN